MPLQRRLPKRGFHNPFRVAYEVVNVGQLEAFDAGAEVTPAALQRQRLLRRGKAAAQGPRRRDADARPHGARPRGEHGGAPEDRGGRRPRRDHRVAAAGNRETDGPDHPKHLRDTGAAQADPVHVRPARGLPHRGAHPDAGHRPRGARRLLRGLEGDAARLLRHVLGRRAAAADDLRARDHALHRRGDHPRAAQGGHPAPGAPGQGGRGRAQEADPVHPLRDDRDRHRPGARDLDRAREHDGPGRRGDRAQPRAWRSGC